MDLMGPTPKGRKKRGKEREGVKEGRKEREGEGRGRRKRRGKMPFPRLDPACATAIQNVFLPFSSHYLTGDGN